MNNAIPAAVGVADATVAQMVVEMSQKSYNRGVVAGVVLTVAAIAVYQVYKRRSS